MSSLRPSNSNKPGKGIGQGMLVISFVIVLAGLTFFFNGKLEQQRNPNRNPDSMVLLSGIREVVLEQNRKGHYVAGGKVNGVPVTFLLDTGATDVAVPESIALQAGLERGNASFAATANGIVTVYSTRINELVLGNIVLKDINASITTSMVGNTILLGMSALKQIEFTQRGTTLTLHHIPKT